MTSYNTAFITGCDRNTQWQLPWFSENFKKHNPNSILGFVDFGADRTRSTDFIQFDFSIKLNNKNGWFSKPFAISKALQMCKKVCWLDTDCEVLAPIQDIFEHSDPMKVGMVRDNPWTTRRSDLWFNTGVVLFEGRPPILNIWKQETKKNNLRGDQEILYNYLRQGINNMIHVKELPHRYNVLRLDLQDGTQPKDPAIIHWTGQKGKLEIRKKMGL